MILPRVAVGTLLTVMACAHEPEPPGPAVHQVSIEGNRTFSDREIEAGLATSEPSWWPLARKPHLDPATLEIDLRRIVGFYAHRGFLDARVLDHRLTRRPDGSVDVLIRIDEGPPTMVTRIAFAGLPPGGEVEPLELAERAGVRTGSRLEHARHERLKARLEQRLREAGHAYARVDLDAVVDRRTHEATIHVEVAPGPRVRFGTTRLSGHGALDAAALLRRVAWKEGDWFDPELVATTQARLYDTGVFAWVRVELPRTPTETADVTIRVTPGRLREIRLGGGLAIERQREEVRLRAEWTSSNFLGGLRRLRIRTKPAYVVIPGVAAPVRHGVSAENDLRLTQPDLLATGIELQGLVGYDVGIAPGYQYHGPRALAGLERAFVGDRVRVTGAWNLQFLDFFDIDREVFDPRETRLGLGFKDPYRLAFVEATAQLDLRDRVLDPSRGGYLLLRAEQGAPALGGDFSYLRLTPEARLYLPVGDRLVLAARGLGGWLRPFAGGAATDSPVTRRYALGGPSSHRGFAFGRLAPQVQDAEGRWIPLGGDGQLLFSGELRVEVARLGDRWLSVVPFVDAGDVTVHASQLDPARLHVATGLSLEYDTLVGIVRGGIGVRLNRTGAGNPDPGDRLAFHVTLGEAF